jgi:hypothetical protein
MAASHMLSGMSFQEELQQVLRTLTKIHLLLSDSQTEKTDEETEINPDATFELYQDYNK